MESAASPSSSAIAIAAAITFGRESAVDAPERLPATIVPERGSAITTPSRTNDCSACAAVAFATFQVRASARVEGTRAPGGSVPASI